MSFIFDALKKSEECRCLHEGMKPKQKILALHRSKPSRWPSLLFLATLAVALVSGWWLHEMSMSPVVEKPPAGSLVAPVPLDQPTTTADSSPLITAQTDSPGPLAQEAVRPAPFAPVPAGEASGELTTPTLSPSRTAARPTPAASRAPSKDLAISSPGAMPRPVAREVPVPVHDRLSKLTMSLHYYTEEPSRRMIRIDNRIVREGQSFDENLVLEEITPDGAIFSLAGERFEVRGPRTY